MNKPGAMSRVRSSEINSRLRRSLITLCERKGIAGSTDIVIDITPMQSAYAPERPHQQFGAALGGMGQRGTFVHEPLQKRIHRPACMS
jgi:hypothetical protein